MSTLVLVSLIVFFAAILIGLAIAGWKALDAWRAFKQFRRTALAGMGELNDRAVRLEARMNGLSGNVVRLERARGRLEESLAEVRVLMAGASEVAAFVEAVRGVVPSR